MTVCVATVGREVLPKIMLGGGFVGMVTQQATATVDAAETGLQDNTAWESASAHVVMPGPGFQNNGGETEHSDVAD